jgi:hypothetical protein
LQNLGGRSSLNSLLDYDIVAPVHLSDPQVINVATPGSSEALGGSSRLTRVVIGHLSRRALHDSFFIGLSRCQILYQDDEAAWRPPYVNVTVIQAQLIQCLRNAAA